MKPQTATFCLVLICTSWSTSARILPAQPTPQSVVDELLDADRAFAAGGATTTVIPALTTMFTRDVIMPAPGGLMRGLPAVTEALQSNAANTTATLTWAPVRGGVSADGLHGFTFGYMTMRQGTSDAVLLKYLAYWVKREGRWQVAGYKRRPRPAGETSTTLLPASLPAQLVSPSTDPAVLVRHRDSLVAAEQAFSDEAQQIGLGPAFTKYGLPDAMNMGGPDDAAFVIGNVAIGRSIGAGAPGASSPVFWSADEAIVASSGDLGITFGYIRWHPIDGQPARPPVPFFTIWRRIDGVWRYVAE